MNNKFSDLKFLYAGKAKEIYQRDEETLIMYFTDRATAFNGKKSGLIEDKGSLNCQISSLLMQYLKGKGISTHFIEQIDLSTQLVKKVDIIPLEVVTRNLATGSLLKRIPLEEGTRLEPAIVELFFKSDELNDPLINDEHAFVAGIIKQEELKMVKDTARRINSILFDLLDKYDMVLVDMKLEFGRTSSGDIILADEISPDTMRVWDKQTGKKMDKDRFRQNLGQVREGYAEILSRLKEGKL